MAEATADLADAAWRAGKSREFSLMQKDLARLLEACRDGAGSDDAGAAGRVESEPVEPRGLAAILGSGAPVGDDAGRFNGTAALVGATSSSLALGGDG